MDKYSQKETLLDSLNLVTDNDFAWIPFFFLKPPKDKLMTNKFIIKITLYFVPLYYSILVIGYHNQGGEITFLGFVFFLFLFMILFFALYKYIFAIPWNNRAKQLQKKTN
jgi:hypothetical protein